MKKNIILYSAFIIPIILTIIIHIYGFPRAKAEIDNFIKQQAVERYKSYCRSFMRDSTLEASVVISDHADYMHNVCGMSYDEIEAIEIEVFSA